MVARGRKGAGGWMSRDRPTVALSHEDSKRRRGLALPSTQRGRCRRCCGSCRLADARATAACPVSDAPALPIAIDDVTAGPLDGSRERLPDPDHDALALRELHVELGQAVLAAYGRTDHGADTRLQT